MTIKPTLPWPPDFTIKKSPRARYVRLKASLKHGLELVIPTRFNQQDIPLVLEQNRKWIEKQLRELQAKHSPLPNDSLPDELTLLGGELILPITYLKSTNKKLQLFSRQNADLAILGDTEQKNLCIKLIINWAKTYSRSYLKNEIERLSKTINLPFQKLTVRNQVSRWGSCTSDKNISLNYKLIFLPHELITHILIHELCHTAYLDHSKKFWGLVEKWDANYKQHRVMLRKVDFYIPHWIHIHG